MLQSVYQHVTTTLITNVNSFTIW